MFTGVEIETLFIAKFDSFRFIVYNNHMAIKNKAHWQQSGIPLVFLIALSLTLLAIPVPAETVVDITEDQDATIELGDFFTPTDIFGTATIYSGVTVNDAGGLEAVIVNDSTDDDPWTIENHGSLISEDADSVYINTNCTVNNNGTILSELLAGVYVLADPGTLIELNNSAGGLIQGGASGVSFDLSNNGTGVINNNGTIIGDVGIQVYDGATTTTLTNTGTITGLAGSAVILGDNLDTNTYTLDNSGTITGNDPFLNQAVALGSGDDWIILQDGSRVIGGDIATGLGNNTLTVMTGAQMINGNFEGQGVDLLNLDGNGTGAVTWDVFDFENLFKTGTGRWTLETLLALIGAGTITISEGDLGVNTVVTGLGSAVTIAAPGTLSGNGSLDSGINSDGTIAPGNGADDPFGTLDVTGDVAFNAASVMAVDIGANGRRDLLNLTGTATVNGAADIDVNEYTAIPHGDLIDVILATSVSGPFAPLVQDPPSLLVTFSQQALGDRIRILTARIAYSTFAETDNQSRVADALLQSVGDCTEDLGTVLAYIDFLPTEQDLQNAYEQLQPKPYAIHPDLTSSQLLSTGTWSITGLLPAAGSRPYLRVLTAARPLKLPLPSPDIQRR